MDKKYVRIQVLAEAADVHPAAVERLIRDERTTPDAYIQWGVTASGNNRYRPMFLESRVPELVATIKKYKRSYVSSSLKK